MRGGVNLFRYCILIFHCCKQSRCSSPQCDNIIIVKSFFCDYNGICTFTHSFLLLLFRAYIHINIYRCVFDVPSSHDNTVLQREIVCDRVRAMVDLST